MYREDLADQFARTGAVATDGFTVCEPESTVYLTFAPLGAGATTFVEGRVGDRTCYDGSATFEPSVGDEEIHPVRVDRVADFEGCDDRTTAVTLAPIFKGYAPGATCDGDPDTWGSDEVYVGLSEAGGDCFGVPLLAGDRVVPTCGFSPCATEPLVVDLPDGTYTVEVLARGAHGTCNSGTHSFTLPGPTDLTFEVPSTSECEHPEAHPLTIRPTWARFPGLGTRTCAADDVWSDVYVRRVSVAEAGTGTCDPYLELAGVGAHHLNCSGFMCVDDEALTGTFPEGRYVVTVEDEGADGVVCWRGEQEVDLTRARDLEVALTYTNPPADGPCRNFQ